MTISLFDSHCHFDFAVFDQDRSELWQACQQQGIHQLLIPGVSPAQWQTASILAEKYPGIYTAIGLHPWWLDGQASLAAQQYQELLAKPHCVAIGECGLDKAIAVSFEHQLEIFDQHLRLACDLSLPVIIHVRQTHNETIRALKRYQPPKGGVIHGFTGSLAQAMDYWRMGFYLGVGGSISYERAKKTRATIQAMPLEALVLETDAPDMPLKGYQGQRNTPLRLMDIAQALAALQDKPLELIAEQTSNNTNRLFAIK